MGRQESVRWEGILIVQTAVAEHILCGACMVTHLIYNVLGA